MPPLILHNVPDDELYVGADGIQRPYAMVFPGSEGHTGPSRAKKHAPETGSFGKSIRRSRSRGTPAKREDPTILAADAIFSKYLSDCTPAPSESQRKSSVGSSQANPGSQTSVLAPTEGSTSPSHLEVQKVPTEVILRGFKSAHQYAAIKHFEHVAGLICEDYPRDPPIEQRRFKADIRDSNSYRTRSLTPEERAKALRFDGGENWIKITFESAEAAEAAIYASPQNILGYQVFAEPYRGVPPTNEEEIPAFIADPPSRRNRHPYHTISISSSTTSSGNSSSHLNTHPGTFVAPSPGKGRRWQPPSPPESQTSSSTLDTATLSTVTAESYSATLSSSTIQSGTNSESQPPVETPESIYCRGIPTAKRIQLRPADQALLPQPSLMERIAEQVPWLAFFSASIIGTEIPRTENGEFDWALASLYWRIWWVLDFYFGLCGGDVAGSLEKEE